MWQATTPQEASFIKIRSDLLVDWTVKCAWLYPGLHGFTPEGSQAGRDVDSPTGEHPKEVCCKRHDTPGTRLCQQTAQAYLPTR